jgi:hypothetical protein
VLTLRELQERFAGAVFDGEVDAVAAHIDPRGLDAADRVAIYRNNLREGFTKALALEFPVIERLVGTEYFRQLAAEFLVRHPSRAGNLHHIGEPFPAYLKRRYTSTPYAYFADVAALEWAYQDSMIAADAPVLSPDALQEIDPARYEELTFVLQPWCRLVRSDYPVLRIWRANQPETVSDDVIDLDSGGDCILVRRSADGVEFHRIPPAEFALLDAFARGECLGTALERAQATDTTFDLGQALRRAIALGLLAAIHLPASLEEGSRP